MERCRINHEIRNQGRHQVLWDLHRELLRLRREIRPLGDLSKEHLRLLSFEAQRVIAMFRSDREDKAIVLLCYQTTAVEFELRVPAGNYARIFDSAEARWLGPGAIAPRVIEATGSPVRIALLPESVTVYLRQ